MSIHARNVICMHVLQISTCIKTTVMFLQVINQILYSVKYVFTVCGVWCYHIVIWSTIEQLHMWVNLRKVSFHVRNSKSHFSPSNDGYMHLLTILASNGTGIFPSWFCCDLYLRLLRRPEWYLHGPITPWEVDNKLWCAILLADMFGHGFSCFVCY